MSAESRVFPSARVPIGEALGVYRHRAGVPLQGLTGGCDTHRLHHLSA